MNYLLAAAALVFIIFLTYGAITKKVRLKNCCVDPNPENDLRMRDAFLSKD